MNYSTRNKNKTVKFIIIHYTGMINFSKAFEKLFITNSKVSCHYLISREGIIYNLLPIKYKAWHAGISKWQNYNSLNDYSVGIELENKGHEFGYQDFTKKQYISLNKLITSLVFVTRVNNSNIIGHSDISPNRKKDPGERFKWNLITKKKQFIVNFKLKRHDINSLLKAYGFPYDYISKYKKHCIMAVKRRLGYKKINSIISKNFIINFKLLIKSIYNIN